MTTTTELVGIFTFKIGSLEALAVSSLRFIDSALPFPSLLTLYLYAVFTEHLNSFRDSAKRRISNKGKKKKDLYKGAKFERKKDDFLGNNFSLYVLY